MVAPTNMNEHREFPKRKPNRLRYYDYSSEGTYFITICAKDRRLLFGQIVERPGGSSEMILSETGKIVSDAIRMIPEHYNSVVLEHFVVMPNHVHLLLRIETGNGRPMVVPTISTVVQQMKGYVTKQVGYSVWQKLFHDHVVRDEKSFIRLWEYVENNPEKWAEDCFYTK